MTLPSLRFLFCLIIAANFARTSIGCKLLADELPKLTTLSDSNAIDCSKAACSN